MKSGVARESKWTDLPGRDAPLESPLPCNTTGTGWPLRQGMERKGKAVRWLRIATYMLERVDLILYGHLSKPTFDPLLSIVPLQLHLVPSTMSCRDEAHATSCGHHHAHGEQW